MTFKDLQDDALERTNYDNSLTPSIPRTRISRFINEAHRRILTTPGMERLRDDILTFPTVANQQVYALPQAIDRINRIYEPTTNKIRLVERSLDWLRNIPTTTAGVPEAWVPIGTRQVAAQPASTGVWIVSSSASDTTQSVIVEGFRSGSSGGDPVVATSATLNGTTRVQVGTFTDWVEVDKFYLNGTAVGTVTLYDAASSGNVLAVIPIGQTAAKYFTIAIWPTPSSAWTLYVDYTRVLTDMVNDTDVPFLPDDFHWMLSLMARRNEYEYKNDLQRMMKADQDLLTARAALMDFVCNNPDYMVIPGFQDRRARFSNLGSYYPAGTW